jgi:hypothetical protein
MNGEGASVCQCLGQYRSPAGSKVGRCPPATSGTGVHCLQSLIIVPAYPVYTHPSFIKSDYLLRYLSPLCRDLIEILIIIQLVKKCSRFYALTCPRESIIERYLAPAEFNSHNYALFKFCFNMSSKLCLLLSNLGFPSNSLYASLKFPLLHTNSIYLTLLNIW